MISQCNKLTFSKAVNKSLPCINRNGHQARCTPNLIGQKIGKAVVLRLGPRQKPQSYTKNHKGAGIITWILLQNNSLSSGIHRTKQQRNKQHQKLGHFSIQELRVEARRRGYKLIKITI